MRERRRLWGLALRHFVHLDQRNAGAGPVGAADLGRVGPRRQSQNQRRVFAAVRERKGAGVPRRLRRGGGLGAGRTPVIVKVCSLMIEYWCVFSVIRHIC